MLSIYSHLAVLGLHCRLWAFSSCSKQGYSSLWCRYSSHGGGFPCCRAQALGCMGFSSCDLWAQKLQYAGYRVQARAHFGSTYTKIGTIQRRLAWPLRKDDMQICEVFHIFNSQDMEAT